MAIIATYPTTLVNGTTADATQVMSLFNFIQSQVNANALPDAGGTVTGNLLIQPTTGGASVTVTAPAGQSASLLLGVTGQKQYSVSSGASGNFNINDITDGNANYFSISPAGAVTIPQTLTVNGATTLANTGITGNLIVTGSIGGGALTATTVVATTNIQVTAPSSTAPAYYYATVPSVRQWYWGTNTDGTWALVDNTATAERMSFDASGNATIYQSLSVANQITGNNIIANGAVYVGGSTAGTAQILYTSGTTRIHQYQTSWFWDWDIPTGNLLWNNGTGSAQNVQFSANGNCVNKTGIWITWSDIRIKQDIEDYHGSLEQICRLRPRRFRFKADVAQDKAAPFHIGIVAQEAEAVLPEMIESGPHTRDGIEYEDFRTASNGPVIWALVNAVRELSARVETLEARLSAEGR